MFFVFLLYALFASCFTVAKTALEYTQPFFLVGSRMAVAGIILLGYLFVFQRKSLTFKKEHLPKLLALAALNIYLTNAFEFFGLRYLTTFKTCFIYSLSPFASALFSYFIFSEKMTPKKWLGLLVGFVGFAPILLAHTATEELGGNVGFLSWAELAVIGAAICSVLGWILLKQLVVEGEYSPILANGLSMLIGGAFSLTHSYIVEPWDPVPVTEYLPFLMCSAFLIVVSNLICYNMYGWLLQRFSATFMSFAGFTTPLFTALFGWFYLGETVTWPFYLSAVIVFSGLTLFYQEELKPSLKYS